MELFLLVIPLLPFIALAAALSDVRQFLSPIEKDHLDTFLKKVIARMIAIATLIVTVIIPIWLLLR